MSGSLGFTARVAALAVCSALAGLAMPRVHAGLAASDVVVVVNGASFNSRTLANHFVALRNIPQRNVVVLDGVPNSEVVDVDEFRAKILVPLTVEIERRKLLGHVHCIAYSADFPTAIDITTDLEPLGKLKQIYTPKASINGLTYLRSWVLGRKPFYIGMDINYYARRNLETYFSAPLLNDADQWTAIEQLISDEQFAQASMKLEQLFEEQPHQFPVAYLASASAAQAGEVERGVELLQRAIDAGWNSGGFLSRDKRMDALRDNPDFQILELALTGLDPRSQSAVGFRTTTYWTPNGIGVPKVVDNRVNPDAKQYGVSYVLSTMLGVTRRSGSTLAQAVEALRRSSQADFTHPHGGFYFCDTDDIRTKTRRGGFEKAANRLRQMGFEAEVVKTALPRGKARVLGAQTGAARFSWPAAGSSFVPGAIADNLTSLGGVMTAGSRQTKLTEFIKAGAAGSSGTVTEPYSIQQKFPLPQMYVHYASGASLAEAFYMNVTGPYQLLIVGDPLCRPFSNAPQPKLDLSLRRLEPGEQLTLNLDPGGLTHEQWLDSQGKQAERTEPMAANRVTVLFDGVGPQARGVLDRLNFNLVDQPPGYHELTLRWAADDPLEQATSSTVPIWIGDPKLVEISLPDQDGDAQASQLGPEYPVAYAVSLRDQKMRVRVEAEQAQRVTLWHDWEQLGVAAGREAEFSLPLKQIGLGPARLMAKAELESGKLVQSLPLRIEVLP